MYALPAGGVTATLNVAEASLLRVLAEPANILTPRLTIEVRMGAKTILTPSEVIGSVPVTLTEPGTYEVNFVPGEGTECRGCLHQLLPFMFTIGLAAKSTLDAEVAVDEGRDCPS